MGNFNSRNGTLYEIAIVFSPTRERKITDRVTDAHEKHFISYLSDVGEYVVNGRGSSYADEWINVSVANKGGTAVVDYFTRK